MVVFGVMIAARFTDWAASRAERRWRNLLVREVAEDEMVMYRFSAANLTGDHESVAAKLASIVLFVTEAEAEAPAAVLGAVAVEFFSDATISWTQ